MQRRRRLRRAALRAGQRAHCAAPVRRLPRAPPLWQPAVAGMRAGALLHAHFVGACPHVAGGHAQPAAAAPPAHNATSPQLSPREPAIGTRPAHTPGHALSTRFPNTHAAELSSAGRGAGGHGCSSWASLRVTALAAAQKSRRAPGGVEAMNQSGRKQRLPSHNNIRERFTGYIAPLGQVIQAPTETPPAPARVV